MSPTSYQTAPPRGGPISVAGPPRCLPADRLVDALDTDLIHLVSQIDRSTYLLAAAMVLGVTLATLAIGSFSARRRSEPERAGDAVPTAVSSRA
jgi:hypothetical protein